MAYKKVIAVILGLITISFTFTLVGFMYRQMWFSINNTLPDRWFIAILGTVVFNILFFTFVNIEKPFGDPGNPKK